MLGAISSEKGKKNNGISLNDKKKKLTLCTLANLSQAGKTRQDKFEMPDIPTINTPTVNGLQVRLISTTTVNGLQVRLISTTTVNGLQVQLINTPTILVYSTGTASINGLYSTVGTYHQDFTGADISLYFCSYYVFFI